MPHSLRKLAASISVFYADGTASRSLVATDFHLDAFDASLMLRMDLSSNLELRHHAAECRREALRLQRDHAQVRGLRIHDRGLAANLARIVAHHAGKRWQLSLRCGRPFVYAVDPDIAEWDVSFVITRRRPVRYLKESYPGEKMPQPWAIA